MPEKGRKGAFAQIERANDKADERMMADGPRKILICSCEDTMPLDAEAVRRACRGAEVVAGRHLCRAELARVQNALAGGDAVTIACTQEAPLFKELAADAGDAEARGVSLRQYPRDRRLVEGRDRGRAEDGGADRGGGRAGAGAGLCRLCQRRRDGDLRQRRARHRSRATA